MEGRDADGISQKDRKVLERKHEVFLKNVTDEFTDTFTKVKGLFTKKLEKNWKRINERLQNQKISSEDFQQVHLFMSTLVENLKSHFRVNTLNLLSVSEEYQKKFLMDFKTKKTDELKLLLDNELWTHSQVNLFFQTTVDRINSIEMFEQRDPANDMDASSSSNMQVKDTISTPDCEYKICISLTKFIHMVYEFLTIIKSFP